LKRIAVGTALLGLVLVLALAACDTGSQAIPVKPTPTAAAAGRGIPTGQRIIASGRVTPVTRADLNLNAAGTVVDVLVAEGDTVKKDQPLLRVDKPRRRSPARKPTSRARRPTRRALRQYWLKRRLPWRS